MSIGREAVRRFADLARLRLEDAELDRLTEDVNRILEHVDALRQVETAEEDEAPQVSGETAAERADGPDPLHRSVPELAPEWREGFFIVPHLPGVDAE